MSITRGRRTCATTGLALAVTTTLLLSACSSGGSGSAAGGAELKALPKTLVFSPLALSVPSFKDLSQGLTAYAGQKGWKVVVQDPKFNPTTQNQQLSTVLQSGQAGAAWVLANDPKSMAATLKTAQSKGVPVLVNGSPADYGFDGAQPGITFDYVDYAAAGKALGDQLGQCITQKLNGKAEVLFAQSTPGQAGKDEFEQAALASLKAAAPDADVVQSLVVSDRAAGQTAIGNTLQGHPALAGVMASTDESALGALGAFDAAGKNLTCLANFGGNDEVVKDVNAGKIFASVALQFQADMAQSFETLVTMQSDPEAAGQVLTVPQKIITAEG